MTDWPLTASSLGKIAEQRGWTIHKTAKMDRNVGHILYDVHDGDTFIGSLTMRGLQLLLIHASQ